MKDKAHNIEILQQPLNLPPFSLKIQKKENGQLQIYDILRRKYLALTPEEWVRQHFIHYLITEKKYPQALLGNEISLFVNQIQRRCDSILFHKIGGRPRMIIEYKAPHIPITQEVFNQIYSYNTILRADYLTVSNGMQHYCFFTDYQKQEAQLLKEIPLYQDLT